jgi:predicted dehydrogenase
MVFKILVIGLGSMGKRRVRNLQKLGYKNIIGFDLREDRCVESKREYGIKTFTNFAFAITESPNILIISTPPHLHDEYINYAIKHKIPFFSELNLFSNVVKKSIKKINKTSIIGCSSSTMRFHPVVKKLKNILDKKTIGRIFMVNHQVGHYLPNWHPWEDYHDFFVSRKDTGGAKELVPVELNWLTYLFSDIKSVVGNVRKISDLDVDIDDVYQAILNFDNNITCTLTIDVFSKPSFKETKIIGEKGIILVDFQTGKIKINKGKKWEIINLKINKVAKGYLGLTPPEKLYEEELHSFLKFVKNKTNTIFTLENELKLLRVLDGIEKSSKNNKRIEIRY